MSETSIPQGELIVGKVVHGAAMNCMIVPYDDPEGWYFQQFFSTAAIEEFAAKHNLIMKGPENGNQGA